MTSITSRLPPGAELFVIVNNDSGSANNVALITPFAVALGSVADNAKLVIHFKNTLESAGAEVMAVVAHKVQA